MTTATGPARAQRPTARYLIGLGSNRRGRHGSPAAEVEAALAAIGGVVAWSGIAPSAPIGPSIRRFANAAAVIASDEAPPALLARLKAIERAFGRRRGRRWGARVIDLDILLWSGGGWGTRTLTLPHPQLARRRFVLDPARRIAPDWRMPGGGSTIAQAAHRLTRRRALL